MNSISQNFKKSNIEAVNAETIRRVFRLFFENESERREIFVKYPDSVTVTDGKKQLNSQKFFGAFGCNDVDKLLAALEAHREHWESVYIGLNPTEFSRLASCELHGGARSNEEHIPGYRLLAIDFDRTKECRSIEIQDPLGEPVKVKVNASDEDLNRCRKLAEKCREKLSASGVESLLACSGNGYHLVVAVNLGKEEKHVVSNFLKYLCENYSTDAMEVDTQLTDACRVIKLYGTMTRKYPETDGRPHRLSYIVDAPEKLRCAPAETIRMLAAKASKPEGPGDYPRAGQNQVPGLELDSEENVTAAIGYLTTAEPAVEGDGGDRQTFDVACKVADFGISRERCLELMEEYYNPRCTPEWEVRGGNGTLEAKVNSAYKINRKNLIGCESPKYKKEQLLGVFEVVEGTPEGSGGEAVSAQPAVKAGRPLPKFQKLGVYRKIPHAELEFFVDNLFFHRKSLSLMYGDGGSGKTTLLYQMVSSVMRGIPFLGLAAQRVGRLGTEFRPGIISLEEPPEDIALREQKQYPALFPDESEEDAEKLDPVVLNLWGENVEFVKVERGVVRPGAHFNDVVGQVKEARLNFIGIDNLGRIFPGEENDRGQAMQFGTLMNHFIDLTGATVLLLAHNNKAHQYSGSTAWNAACRNRYYVRREGEGASAILTLGVGKSNLIATGDRAHAVFRDWVYEPLSEDQYKSMSEKASPEDDTEAVKDVMAQMVEALQAYGANGGVMPKAELKSVDEMRRPRQVQERAISLLLEQKKIELTEYRDPQRHKREGYRIVPVVEL